MSDAIIVEKTLGLAAKNDALRDAFEPDGSRCFLLRRAGETSAFTVIRELTNGWQRRWSEFRGQWQFRLATTDPAIGNDFAIGSHIAYGVPDSDDEIEVFVIEDSTRDILPPTGSSVYWKAFVSKVRHERFRVPVSQWILQRTIEGANLFIAMGSPIITVMPGEFTVADIGRRLFIENAVDGVIQSVTNQFQVVIDTLPTNAPFFGDVLIYDPA